MIGTIANWLVSKAHQHQNTIGPQHDRSKWLGSSVREVEGAGRFGAKRRPVNQASMVNRFGSWVYACAMLNARAIASVPLRLYAQKPRGARPMRLTRGVSHARWRTLRRTTL